MIIKDINLDELSRKEYINFILTIMCYYKVNYNDFAEIEKDFIKDMMDKNIKKMEIKI